MWIKDKPEESVKAGQSEGMEMDNLEAAVPREGRKKSMPLSGRA